MKMIPSIPSIMVQDCEDNQEKLNEWESNFMQSIHDQHYMTDYADLSDKQLEVLQNIWERVT